MKKTNSVCGKGSMWGHFGGSRTAGLQKKTGCCQGGMAAIACVL